MNNRNNNSDFGSWFLIFVLFATGAWPIALFILVRKLFFSDTPKEKRREAPSLYEMEERRRQQEEIERLQKKVQQAEKQEKAKDFIKSLVKSPKENNNSSIALIIAGALVMAAGLFFAGSAISAGTATYYTTGTAIAAMLGGGSMIFSGIGMRKSMQREAAYLAIIGPNDAVEISVVAKKVGVSTKQAEKDLQKMIDKGMFGDSAYINRELGYLFMSSSADEELAKARKAALEKTKEASRKEAAKHNVAAYDQILEQIHSVNEQIPDEEMTKKIDQIESITQEIFRAVEQEPEKRGKIDRFMSYFLPTTLKLLESYANLSKTNIDGKNISQSKKSIEVAMDTIVDGFKHQLDELYKTDAVSIETEVDVLTKMINRETATAQQEFGLGSGGAAVQTAPTEKK